MACKRILLVEGSDDEHVLKHICGNRGIPPLDQVEAYNGISRLLDSIHVRLKASVHSDIVGVVIDADTDLGARWQSLRNQLIHNVGDIGYTVPEQPVDDGTILFPPDGTLLPRVGIWIMPDNQTNGILEDFLRFLIPPESKLFDHVQTSVAAIPQAERRFRELDYQKAIVHTWLAWQEKPGKPLGTAITASFLNHNVPEVDALVNWLKRLFFYDQLP